MKKRSRKKFSKKGFTLVEIMIVVAIIGLLAAIAIPNLLRARINSNDGAVQGDLRAFSTAIESYRAAQQPPRYPATVDLLTAVAVNSPPYLDATWTTNGVTKHGHTLTYRVAANGSTYSNSAVGLASQSNRGYCVDHSGVLRTAATAGTLAAGGTAAGCPVAMPAVTQ